MIVVVGGGIAGVACARVLARAGADVRLLDRGARLGGRLGVRYWDHRPVDIGGSYFTVSDPEFEAVVADWQERDLARPWTDTFTVHSGHPGKAGEAESESSGPMRWAAPAGLRGLVDDLAEEVDARSSTRVELLDRDKRGLVVDGRHADAVVLAMPDPQARRLLGPGLAEESAGFDLDFEPVLVSTTIWPERRWDDRDGIFVNDDDVLAWVADDGLRRGDRAPVLVAHSTSDFARLLLAGPDRAAEPMEQRLKQLLGLAPDARPVVSHVHRWSFARPERPRDEPYLLTGSRLGACGDGWSAKPSVEAAFVSGTRLARALLD